jgi:hypothetical protein
MLAFMQLIFRYGFFKIQNIPLALADWQYGFGISRFIATEVAM